MSSSICPKKTINKDIVNKLLESNLESGIFCNYGPNVTFLEDLIRKNFCINDDKSIIAITNGSLALNSLTRAINHHENSELNWATQSFTFPPSAQNTLSDVMIIDIDLEGGLDLNKVPDNINGLIVTNVFGNCVDIDKYTEYCKKNNKKLIFDNAATANTFYKGSNCCNYGIGSIISFHHTKAFGFGEGGAIIVDKKYEDSIRKINNFGFYLNKNILWDKNSSNYKMSEISAVYIIQYLIDKFDIIVKKHQELNYYFRSKVNKRKMNYLKFYPSFHDNNNIVPSCFCILFDNYDKQIEDKLKENNIFCRKYYVPLIDTLIATKFYNHILCIPCNIDMNFEDIDKILDIIYNFYLSKK